MNGHRPAALTALLARVEGRADEVRSAAEGLMPVAEGAARAANEFVRSDAAVAGTCLDPRCFRRGTDGHCEYHDPANLFEVTVNANATRRYLRSLAYAEGVTAEADALDAEVPRVAGQILVDRAPRIAADGDSGVIGSLLALIHAPGVEQCTIEVALPPEAAAIYARAAAGAAVTRERLVGVYLDRIAADVWESSSLRDHR